MSFAHPWFLALLLALPVLAWLKGRHGQQAAFLYSSVDLLKGVSDISRSSAGRLLPALRWLALGLLIVGLARPQKIDSQTIQKASGVDIVVVLDMSESMRSEDFKLKGQPANRLTVAKEVLRQFIDKRPNDRIGIVAFGAQAYIAAPLTLDHAFLQQNLERLDFGVLDGSRTAIGSALTVALNRLRDVKSKSKVVILMTDGQNNAGQVPPLTATEAAQALGVKVYTIGVGTRGMAPMPTGRVDWLGRKEYRQIPVDIDEDTLKAIAAKTGGQYYRADSTDTLQRIYNEIDRLEKTEVELKKYVHVEEWLHWAVAPGLALLLLETLLAHILWRRLP
jgi:Ca-activated chloride channel family protein